MDNETGRTDDNERWMRTRVLLEKVTFDASEVDPRVRSLCLQKSIVPDGELAKLPNLESLVINGGTAESIDLRGCRNLRQLNISYVGGLTDIIGLDELESLEELDLYALPRIETLPSLQRLTELWRMDIGSMKGLKTGLAPVLTAPNLREVQLQSALVMTPGDAELVRDHPRIVGFSWFDARATPAAELRHLFETAGRRSARLRKEGRPPEHEVPQQRLHEMAPEHMVQISVNSRDDTQGGAVHPIAGVGDALLHGEHDFGPGLRQIRITLLRGSKRPENPKLRLHAAKGVLSIDFPSDPPAEAESSPERFSRAATATITALEGARKRVADEVPEFAFEALLGRCRSIRDRMPATAEEVESLIDDAGTRAKTLRIAMHRLQEQRRGRAV